MKLGINFANPSRIRKVELTSISRVGTISACSITPGIAAESLQAATHAVGGLGFPEGNL
jgi:hypothetical protein